MFRQQYVEETDNIFPFLFQFFDFIQYKHGYEAQIDIFKLSLYRRYISPLTIRYHCLFFYVEEEREKDKLILTVLLQTHLK